MKSSTTWRLPRAAAILGAAMIAVMASTAVAQTVEEVIAKNLKAQGGREALLGLKALERKGTVAVDGAFGQLEGTVEEVAIPWKKARRALDLGVFAQKDGYDGKIAWRDGMMGIQDIEGEEANQIKQAVELNPFVKSGERGTKPEKLEDANVGDVACYVVQMTPKEGPVVKLFIDKATDLLKRTSLKQNNPQFGEVEVTIDASDYETFGPIKLATKTKVQLGEVLKIDTTFTETKVNGDVDEAVFEKPKDAAK